MGKEKWGQGPVEARIEKTLAKSDKHIPSS